MRSNRENETIDKPFEVSSDSSDSDYNVDEDYYNFEDDQPEEKPGTSAKVETTITTLESINEIKDELLSYSSEGAKVDPECPLHGKYTHVYTQDSHVFSVTLTLCDISSNINQFFIMQMIEGPGWHGTSYGLWTREGRIGFKGAVSLISCGKDEKKAADKFRQIFLEKTKNEFKNRKQFTRYVGSYGLIEVDFNTSAIQMPNQSMDSSSGTKCQLDFRVRQLLRMLTDEKELKNAVQELDFDTNASPLGKITKEQIQAGYEALNKILELIKSHNKTTSLSLSTKYIEEINNYYTIIPHAYGLRAPPLIVSKEQVNHEMRLLEVLRNKKTEKHVFDIRYEQLNCKITPVELSDPIYEIIIDYLKNSFSKSHYGDTLFITNLFEVDRQAERERFRADLGNRKLLWHGSRMTNWYNILREGLQIAPAGAQITGHAHGVGIYFADMSSKSYSYCYRGPTDTATTKTSIRDFSLLCLAEVALGVSVPPCGAINSLPDGQHSVHAIGSTGPDPRFDKILSDGTVVPCGLARIKPQQAPLGTKCIH
uniref:Poly [ADP-ribose] polymerase n=1 Tax=Ditylenchus dipsaci TaxID=166011 RepID=A0A915CY84_9BILA